MIEFRWLHKKHSDPAHNAFAERTKVLQFKQTFQEPVAGGIEPVFETRWTDWQDIPEVIEGLDTSDGTAPNGRAELVDKYNQMNRDNFESMMKDRFP